ncbi:hypothetical protein ABIE08_002320 [Kaistia defluvii]|uniref:Uncharacterized protein n=1 Tax=Kaistia defluvii TaxID=410841 RepID=A0ABV2QZH8_9HYPH
MAKILGRGIADGSPCRLLSDELIELHPNLWVIIKAVRVDGKTVARAWFTQRRATAGAKAAIVFIGWDGRVALDHLLAIDPTEGIATHKDDRAGAHLAATAAMATSHHRRRF